MNKQGDENADQWEVVEFPAILPDSEKPLWPEFWKKEELLGVKASLPISKWNSQWMQNPTAEEGSIVKREWWNRWEDPDVPSYSYVIQSYDTAFSKKETADYSAITTWAIFNRGDENHDEIILLDAKRVRFDFPELKKLALEEYRYWEPDCVLIEAKASGTPLTHELRRMGIPVTSYSPSRGQDKVARMNSVAPIFEEYRYWEPDCVLIEAKASGTPLTHELRRMGIPVTSYSPSRGQDKVARMNSVAPIFESGMVWAPEDDFAEEVIEEMASFPFGDYDDFCDSATMALMRFRQGGFISLQEDYQDEIRLLKKNRTVYY